MAAPHSPDNRKLARECHDVKIDRGAGLPADLAASARSCSGVQALQPRLGAGKGGLPGGLRALQEHKTQKLVPCMPCNRTAAKPVPKLCCTHHPWARAVYIGSCTGGKTEDFMAAAKLLHKAGGEVKVPTYLVPATQKARLGRGAGGPWR